MSIFDLILDPELNLSVSLFIFIRFVLARRDNFADVSGFTLTVDYRQVGSFRGAPKACSDERLLILKAKFCSEVLPSLMKGLLPTLRHWVFGVFLFDAGAS